MEQRYHTSPGESSGHKMIVIVVVHHDAMHQRYQLFAIEDLEEDRILCIVQRNVDVPVTRVSVCSCCQHSYCRMMQSGPANTLDYIGHGA